MARLAGQSALWLSFTGGQFFVLFPWLISGWRLQEPFLSWEAGRWIGGLLIVLGLLVVGFTASQLVREGHGTPGPIARTDRLVTTDAYGYVRNPMVLGSVAVILGEAMLLGNLALLLYGIGVWFYLHLVIVLTEEPGLRRRFGQPYDNYCRQVPRWLPRLRRGRAGV